MRTTVLSLALLHVCSVVAMQPTKEENSIVETQFTGNEAEIRGCLQKFPAYYIEKEGNLAKRLSGCVDGYDIIKIIESAVADSVEQSRQKSYRAHLSPRWNTPKMYTLHGAIKLYKDQLFYDILDERIARDILRARDTQEQPSEESGVTHTGKDNMWNVRAV